MKHLLCAGLTALGLACAPTAGFAAEAKNIILIIGDGMDDQQITMARNYLAGANGRLTLDRMPSRGVAQVQTVEDGPSGQPVYVADSANSGTAISSGIVTSMGRVGTSATDEDAVSIAELAKAKGMKVGIVSTASVTDATPAAFMAHVNLRTCENPAMMVNAKVGGSFYSDCSPDLKANGGLGSIAEQIADSKVDLVLGGGADHFNFPQEEGGPSILERAQANGFTVVTTREELKGDQGEGRLLGLFSPETMPVRMRAEGDKPSEVPERSWLNYLHRYLGEVTMPEAVPCEANPEFGDTPHLREMTEVALNRLENENGFFLMVESASIDKQSHLRRPCGSIGELEQLEEVLEQALVYAGTHPDTLIVVTADHGQAAQIIPETSMFSVFGVPVSTRGHMTRIITPEGSTMGVNYATNHFQAEEHTGVVVPVYSNEEGKDLFPQMMTQAEIFSYMAEYLDLK